MNLLKSDLDRNYIKFETDAELRKALSSGRFGFSYSKSDDTMRIFMLKQGQFVVISVDWEVGTAYDNVVIDLSELRELFEKFNNDMGVYLLDREGDKFASKMYEMGKYDINRLLIELEKLFKTQPCVDAKGDKH